MADKHKITVILLSAGILVVFLFCPHFTFAKNTVIDYIPRDQEYIKVDKDYSSSPYVLGESSCSVLETLNTKASKCLRCLHIKDLCPDCCLITTGTRKTQCKDYAALLPSVVAPFQPSDGGTYRERCSQVDSCVTTTGESAGATDKGYSDYKTYCSGGSVSGCQAKGCPTTEPGGLAKCTASSANTWVCDQPGIQDLKYPGCVPANKSGVVDCYNNYSGKFYSISPSPSSPGSYIYTVNPDFIKCIGSCNTAANGYEGVFKAYDCCRYDNSICCQDVGCMRGHDNTVDPSLVVRPGYQNNCTGSDSDPSSACGERINWPECQIGSTVPALCCDKLTNDDCAIFSGDMNTLVNCLARGAASCDLPSGTTVPCSSCFNDISKSDDELEYEFVAKSNERLLVIWQVQATPEYCKADTADPSSCSPTSSWEVGDAPDTSFYTTIKIFDDSGTEIYPGSNAVPVLNQRSFIADFSILGAIATGMDNSTPPKSIFKQGQRYRVKLYYLLTPLSNYVLRATVNHSQFIILRIRE